MGDIVKAIEVENTYLEHRMKGEYPFHLVDKIRECGFASLEEYFKEKKPYQFRNLNFSFAEKKPSECIDHFFSMMDAKETGVVFIDSDETFVFSGESKPYDAAYCEENNIPVYPLHERGGAIVSTIGDFSIGICYPESIGADIEFILNRLKDIFDRYMMDVKVERNDILLNGAKVCGSIMYQRNDMRCFAAHFSFNDHSELIEKICGISGSTKIPAIINGLTVALFKQEIRLWLRALSS